MTPESILIFALLVIFSSIISQRRQAKQNRRRSAPGSSADSKTEDKKGKKRTLPDLLGEMHREMKAERDSWDQKSDGQTKKGPGEKTVASKTKKRKEATTAQKESDGQQKIKEPTEAQKEKSPIYQTKEVGRKAGDQLISMNRKAIVQGIVYSEVLGKPKSLRNRRR